MKEIKIKIPAEVVNAIQLKDFEAVAMQSVTANLLESHLLDDDDRVIKSPVFVGYQNKLTQVRKEFEQAKDEMLVAHVEEDIRAKVANWNLDYNSCILYLQVAE